MTALERMPRWPELSDDPNDKPAQRAVAAWLQAIRRVHVDTDLTGFVEGELRGKTVLDIGVVEHAANYFERPSWRHARIAKVAKSCVGIDILAPMVEELRRRGFDVRCVDATSSADLGQRFEAVFIGDVLEHVNDPVALLAFAARHLEPGGRIWASTPNPFCRKFLRQFRRRGVIIVNLDHLAWITPTMAMELARRSGLELAGVHLVKPIRGLERLWKRFTWRFFEPVEYSFSNYLYELRAP